MLASRYKPSVTPTRPQDPSCSSVSYMLVSKCNPGYNLVTTTFFPSPTTSFIIGTPPSTHAFVTVLSSWPRYVPCTSRTCPSYEPLLYMMPPAAAPNTTNAKFLLEFMTAPLRHPLRNGLNSYPTPCKNFTYLDTSNNSSHILPTTL